MSNTLTYTSENLLFLTFFYDTLSKNEQNNTCEYFDTLFENIVLKTRFDNILSKNKF